MHFSYTAITFPLLCPLLPNPIETFVKVIDYISFFAQYGSGLFTTLTTTTIYCNRFVLLQSGVGHRFKRLIQYIDIDTVGHVSFRVFGNSTHIQKLHLRIGYQCGKSSTETDLNCPSFCWQEKRVVKTRQKPANNVFIRIFHFIEGL